MKLSIYINRINKIHHLIISGKTGAPAQLAKKLKMSERRLYEIVEDLRSEKVPIVYSRKMQTYYYERPFEMHASLSLKELNEDDLKNISGGFVHRDFCAVAKCSFVPSMAIGAGDATNLFKKELVLF